MENALTAGGWLFYIRRTRNVVYGGVLAVAVVLTYWQTLFNQFQLKWDDWWVVMNEYTEGGINAVNIRHILTDFYHGQYAPVNEFFYLILYSLFGYNPFFFHLASLLVHLSCVLLVFRLIYRLLNASGDFSETSAWRISFITSLLMAVHPFLVEAVAWMSASKCLLWALFYLAALHAYISYVQTEKGRYFLLTLLFFFLSFGGKEQAVTFPVCLVLFDFALKRGLRRSAIWIEKIPFVIITLGFVVVTFFSQKMNGEGLLSSQAAYSWYQNIVFASYTVIEYFLKCLLPLRLSYIYPFPNQPGEQTPLYMWLYPLALIFLAVGFWTTLKKRWVAFGVGFFLIQASVFSNIMPMARFSIVADRYVYLAAVGVFFLVAYTVDGLLSRSIKTYKTTLVVLSLYVLCLASYARDRSKVWYNSNTLKKEIIDVLKNRPDYGVWKKRLDLPD